MDGLGLSMTQFLDANLLLSLIPCIHELPWQLKSHAREVIT